MGKVPLKIIFFLLFIPIMSFAQRGVVKGVLTTETDGLPLPGASIIIKGTAKGVLTDFDGNYSINCNVGDVLVVTYVGMTSREIKVTAEMFGVEKRIFVEQIPVKTIESDAYNKALKSVKQESFQIPDLEDSKQTFNKNGTYNQFQRIKTIDIKPQHVHLTYFDPDIYFEVGMNSTLSFQYVKNNNLPELQNKFSQGATQNGALTFLGPETGNVFSYGPSVNSLEFDGTNYNFDSNGQLVPLGNGNGKKANAYDNTLFNTAINTSNNIFFNVESYNWIANIDYINKSSDDIFGRNRSTTNDVILSYKTTKYQDRKLDWNTFVKYGKRINNQPNINGFINNLLLNSWITPNSFSNTQGTIIADNTQRSFNPSNYNNPEWLFNNNKNFDVNDLFVVSLQNDIEPSDDFKIQTHVNYKTTENDQNFGLVANTVGFEDGYLSHKTIKKNTFNGTLLLDYEKYIGEIELKLNSVTNYSHDNLKYAFKESEGYDDFSFSNPNSSTLTEHQRHRNTVNLKQDISITHSKGVEVGLCTNSYVSSIQGDKWFLPTTRVQLNLLDLIDIYDFRYIYLSASSAYNINEMPLFYTNQSHNSLTLSPSESLNYTSNIDLFANESIELEEKHDYNFSTKVGFRILNANWNFEANYFGSKTEGSVFPVLENNVFQLQNIADINNRGLELVLEASNYSNELKWNANINFFTNNTEVLKVYNAQERVAIAGFNSVSKNLIVGEPAGIIVGSAYARDEQANLIIDVNGYPMVATEQRIIGDPTPDFTLGFFNALEWKNFKFNFTLNYQKGGDVWNGTQNVLNYFGTSQQSADERGITNFVFDGITQQGNPNTTNVDFYNPTNGIENNRFVRYGFEGVAEDAIEDASFLNLKSIQISYDFGKDYDSFFRQFEIGFYANNLFTFTKYSGASPQSSLFDTNSGNNLNFFNTPLITEVGFKAQLKI